MKSYKLDIKLIIATVGVLSLFIFSILLVVTKNAELEGLGEILLHYGLIIAPVSVLWILMDHYFWHTRLFQSTHKFMNIPPDLRGRWEGVLENADGSQSQKFVIEVSQTLTNIKVHTFTSIGHSKSILCEIASNEHEDSFTLCYLWQGEIHTTMTDIHQNEKFHGYTMLDFHEHEKPKVLKGSYFTNRRAGQTRGGIQLTWISKELKKRIE
jgi:hypothetical protein